MFALNDPAKTFRTAFCDSEVQRLIAFHSSTFKTKSLTCKATNIETHVENTTCDTHRQEASVNMSRLLL